jgi:hypothetical protein
MFGEHSFGEQSELVTEGETPVTSFRVPPRESKRFHEIGSVEFAISIPVPFWPARVSGLIVFVFTLHEDDDKSMANQSTSPPASIFPRIV